MNAEEPADEFDRPSESQLDGDDFNAIVERRTMIEQTKGMLMLVYGIDAGAAFDMLRRQSQQHNVKLRLIVEQIHGDLVELCMAEPPLRQLNATNVLLTAHQRIAAVAARLTDGQSKTRTE
jgi:hypothetical protein